MKPRDAVNKTKFLKYIWLLPLLLSFPSLLFAQEHKEKFVLDSLSNRERLLSLTTKEYQGEDS
ncbi:hypothetical protein KJ640_01785 [bacterium]|nr:hypothetical protein [bacterium]